MSYGRKLLTVIFVAGWLVANAGGQQSANNTSATDVASAKSWNDLKSLGGAVAPRVIFAPDPEFSNHARRKKLTGVSVVSLVVNDQGHPQDVHIERSMADSVKPKLRSAALELDANAVKAVQQYQFEPATLNGKPVPIKVNVEVNFRVY